MIDSSDDDVIDLPDAQLSGGVDHVIGGAAVMTSSNGNGRKPEQVFLVNFYN